MRTGLLAMVFVCALFAQRDLGTIAGTVTDSSGAVVPGAKVTITETDTGEVYTLTTNSSGDFVRPALKPSTYVVSVSTAGFRTAEQRGVLLEAGGRTGVNITLVVGEIGQVLEVTAAAPLLQTESTQVGAVLNTATMTEMPLGGSRNLMFLARLSVGVVPGEANSRDSLGGGFSANGVRSNGQNNYLLNGVDNNSNFIDFLNGASYAAGPSVEAISEMSVQTNGYNAEYGRAAGAVVNVNLKSGTNKLHGSLFEILQNMNLDANPWVFNRANVARSPFRQNQFGLTLGGPIKKSKLFIFGDYQGTRLHTSGTLGGFGAEGYTTVPTAAMKTGNFSSILGAGATGTDSQGNPMSFVKGTIYDPLSTVGPASAPVSRTPFPRIIIPQSRMDPAWAALMQLYPSPNEPVVSGTQPSNDYFYDTKAIRPTDQGDSRVDYRVSDKDNLFGAVSVANTYLTTQPIYASALDQSGRADGYDFSRSAQVSYSRVWNPRLVTETRLAYSRLISYRYSVTAGTDELKAYGIGGFDSYPTSWENGGLPSITFTQGASGNSSGGTYGSAGAGAPSQEYNMVWDIVQNVAISKGTHALKTGFEFRSLANPFLQVQYPHGAIFYSGYETAFPSGRASSLGPTVANSTGDPMASALLGQVDNSAISTTNFISDHKVAYAGYFQDDWKATSKLTINLGVRYELWSPIGEKWGDQANFDLQNQTLYIPAGPNQNLPLPPNFATSFPNVTVDRGHVSKYMIRWDKFDFGPRIGLAWQAFPKTVIRIGYGVFYGGEENQGGFPNRGEGVPFNETAVMNRTSGISSFVGISDPTCTACNFMPGGLKGGFPLNWASLNAAVSFRGVQPDFDNPMVHKWNLIVQRQLPYDTSLELGYEGNHQAHQLIMANSDTFMNLPTTASGYTTLTQQEIPAACPTCGSVGNNLFMTLSNGYGNYAAGSVKIEKRFSHGLQFLTSYTWSHALANSGTPLSGSVGLYAAGNALPPPNDANWASGYASAAWDIRQSFTTGFSYDVPVGKGKRFAGSMSRVADMIVGGWRTNGILSLRKGQPYTMTGASCQGVWALCQPDIASGYKADQAPSGGRNPYGWFDINAYQVATPLTGGDLGLQAATGPPTRTFDFSIFKDFSIRERFRLQFRGEGINVANTPIYAIPDQSLGDKKSLGGNGNFGVITSSSVGTERHIQFSLRLSF